MDIYVHDGHVLVQWHKRGSFVEIGPHGEVAERLRVPGEPAQSDAESAIGGMHPSGRLRDMDRDKHFKRRAEKRKAS